MNDIDQPIWDRLLAEISQPWDWAAGAAGAAAGLVLSAALGFSDLGASAAAGATAVVAARKAAVAARQRPLLGKRAGGLAKQLEIGKAENPENGHFDRLLRELTRERALWDGRAITDPEFSRRLDRLVEGYRQLFEPDDFGLYHSR